MKAKVIENSCIGCGQCQSIVDEVFKINDLGYAEVICDNIPKELEEDVTDAASCCPTNAIVTE